MEILIGIALCVWIVVTLVPFIGNERIIGADRSRLRTDKREAKRAARRAVGGVDFWGNPV